MTAPPRKRRAILGTAAVLAVTAGALALRLARLDQRPMHPDEANQAFKAGLLLETGECRYDPHEHHGPSLYWLTLPSLWLGGAGDLAGSTEAEYRVVPVVFGAGLIVLLLLVADGLGRGPALAAGVLAAVSPAMVFYSRYYIQETLLVFFTLATIACGWRYARSRRAGWAIAAGAFIGLMHATKETWVLAAAAMAAGLVLSVAWTRLRDGAAPPLAGFLRPGTAVALAAAGAAACLAAAALYSSFGRDWDGPVNSILAFPEYLRRGSQGGLHDHPWYYYLQLLTYNRPARGMFWSEGLIVGLAAAGTIASLLLRQKIQTATSPLPQAGEGPGSSDSASTPTVPSDVPFIPSLPFLRFLAFYTLTLTALYAAVPYKTPWCMLTFLDGMTLLAGVGVWAILRALPLVPLRVVAAGLLAAGAVHLGRECYTLNFRLHTDQRNPYVYAHPTSDVVSLARQMERLAAVSPQAHGMVIHVVTPENYWPLPWYLRKFDRDRTGYWPDPRAWADDTARSPAPSIIILTPDVQEVVDANLHAAYNRQMIYGLRPAVLVNVYVREDLWDAFLSAASK